MFICELCGKEYEKKALNQKYCSKSCCKKYHRAQYEKEKQLNNSFEFGKAKCQECKAEFKKKTATHKFCSNECRDKYYHVNPRYYDAKCLICGKHFMTQNKSTKTCSKICLKILLEQKEPKEKPKIIRKNKNHTTDYKSNKSYIQELVAIKVKEIMTKPLDSVDSYALNGKNINYYNINFLQKTRLKVLERDNYKCQICDADTKLEVHHIIPRILGGSHDQQNLVTLCHKCHGHVETGDVNYAIKKCTRNAIDTIENKDCIKSKLEMSLEEKLQKYEVLVEKVYKKLSEMKHSNMELTEVLCDINDFSSKIT